MRTIRIFTKDALSPDSEVKLPPAAAGHISRVLRMEPGDEVTLFDGRGGEYPATLLDVRGSTVHARTGARRDNERESPLRLVLAQGVARGERMDWVVQKATELGVTVIAPVLTERSVVKLDAAQAIKKAEHWRGIAIAACEQCGRNRLPEIVPPRKLDDWLSSGLDAGTRVLLDPAGGKTLNDLQSAAAATVLIGPEGGLSDKECDAARQVGFEGIKLGPRILRTETAGMTAIALLQAKFGDL